MYIKYCEKCGKEQKYKTLRTYRNALKSNSVCKSCAKGECSNNNVKRLLSEELESFYWMGFTAADGHIGNNKRILIGLSSKDEEHLKRFSDYVGIKNISRRNNGKFKSSYVSAQDSKYVPMIALKYGLTHNKTSNPPDVEILAKFKKDEILSFIIGFIDGDGSIKHCYKRKDWVIAIKTHHSWLNILSFFQKTVCGKETAKINKEGYANMTITDVPATVALKRFALEHDLPIMERKWNIIDVNYVTFYQRSKQRLKNVKRLLAENKTINEISEELGLKYSTVYNIITRNNLPFNKNENKSHRKRKGSAD